jgi:hypothetical protein
VRLVLLPRCRAVVHGLRMRTFCGDSAAHTWLVLPTCAARAAAGAISKVVVLFVFECVCSADVQGLVCCATHSHPTLSHIGFWDFMIACRARFSKSAICAGPSAAVCLCCAARRPCLWCRQLAARLHTGQTALQAFVCVWGGGLLPPAHCGTARLCPPLLSLVVYVPVLLLHSANCEARGPGSMLLVGRCLHAWLWLHIQARTRLPCNLKSS